VWSPASLGSIVALTLALPSSGRDKFRLQSEQHWASPTSHQQGCAYRVVLRVRHAQRLLTIPNRLLKPASGYTDGVTSLAGVMVVGVAGLPPSTTPCRLSPVRTNSTSMALSSLPDLESTRGQGEHWEEGAYHKFPFVAARLS